MSQWLGQGKAGESRESFQRGSGRFYRAQGDIRISRFGPVRHSGVSEFQIWGRMSSYIACQSVDGLLKSQILAQIEKEATLHT